MTRERSEHKSTPALEHMTGRHVLHARPREKWRSARPREGWIAAAAAALALAYGFGWAEQTGRDATAAIVVQADADARARAHAAERLAQHWQTLAAHRTGQLARCMGSTKARRAIIVWEDPHTGKWMGTFCDSQVLHDGSMGK